MTMTMILGILPNLSEHECNNFLAKILGFFMLYQ